MSSTFPPRYCPPRVIEVSWRFVGFHRWPEAGTIGRDYLADRHRHTFHCTARIAVDHNDREVEFHDVLDHLQPLFSHGQDLGRRSCEDIADTILEVIDGRWPGRWRSASVMEDGEAGATVTIDPSQEYRP